jgi:hypothetical protein
VAKKTHLYVVGAESDLRHDGPAVDGLMRGPPATAHVIVHAGQHFDLGLSVIFVDQLGGFPDPTYRPEVGSERIADALAQHL